MAEADPTTFHIEHLQLIDCTDTDPPRDIWAWVPITTIETDGYEHRALDTFVEQQGDRIKPGRYRIIERRSYGATFHEYDITLVQKVEEELTHEEVDARMDELLALERAAA